MSDRILVYPLETPSVEDVLRPERNKMIALGKMAQALFGNSKVARGLACTATVPSSMNVAVGDGEIYSYENIDNTAYGTLPADTAHQIMKQAIRLDASNYACPAPSTVGHSICYLIEATFQEVDNLVGTRPFYNADNPNEPFYESVTGSRECHCVVAAKAGTEAPTGTQLPPTPDAGYVGLWVVTVAHGQTTIEAININRYAYAPFIESSRFVYYTPIDRDLSNNYIGTVVPGITAYTVGMLVVAKVLQSNLGDSTLSLNGLPAYHIKDLNGNLLQSGDMKAGGLYLIGYNNGEWVAQIYSASSSAGDPTGLVCAGIFNGRDGWVRMDDGTIGDSSSGATTRANADCETLFKLLWNNVLDAWCPVVGGRGASAIADWSAHKKITLPRSLGRSLCAAGAGNGLTNRVLGSYLGKETVQQTEEQMPHHYHSQAYLSFRNKNESDTKGWAGDGYTSTGGAGSGESHENMSPAIFLNVFIKL